MHLRLGVPKKSASLSSLAYFFLVGAQGLLVASDGKNSTASISRLVVVPLG